MSIDRLIESGLVTRVEGDIAWVNTHSKLTCSSCQVESTCGNAVLEKYLAGKIFVSKITNNLSAKVGDQVQIAIPKTSITKASLIIYWLPLLGFIIGALLADYLFKNEMAAIIGSLIGIVCSLLIALFHSKKTMRSEKYQPTLISKSTINNKDHLLTKIKMKQI